MARLSENPLISLIMCVKDGMPFLPQAVESVAVQTYQNYELIVQDSASTDGTIEYLQGLADVAHIDLHSERDDGIGQAYNWALRRCSGEIIGTIDADNLLEPNALENVVNVFREHPDAACIYGQTRMIDSIGNEIMVWDSPQFDLVNVLTAEFAPPFASAFFSPAVCGEALHFQENMKTCADYDLWLKLGHLPIVKVDMIFNATRISDRSMTRNIDRYDQFAKDKLDAAQRYLAKVPPSPLLESLTRNVLAGIYLWCAESVLWQNAGPAYFQKYVDLALSIFPEAVRAKRLMQMYKEHEDAVQASQLEELRRQKIESSITYKIKRGVKALLGTIGFKQQ